MLSVLFIHSAGSQSAGEGSSRLVDSLRATISPNMTFLAPPMPKPDAPEAEPWIKASHAAIEAVKGDLILIGHSLGGSVLLQTLARYGVPPALLGVVLIGAPFWGAPGWEYEDFALPADAGAKLGTLRKLIILRGDLDDVVAADHPERYSKLLPMAETSLLAGVDHEAADAAPHLVSAINSIGQTDL